MSAAVPPGERIITVEDNAELRLQQPHVVTLEARPANVEGKGEVSIRDLVRNSLRMRPDRIIVGEVRGGETLDMLQAINTGHEGSLVTVHANSPDDAIHRLETLATMSDLHIPFEALRDQINSAIHVIVQIDRYADGKRRIAEVALVASTRRETFRLGTVARFEADPVGPDRRVTGTLPPLPAAAGDPPPARADGPRRPARVRPRGRRRPHPRARGGLMEKDTLALLVLLAVMALMLLGAALYVGGSNRRAALAARGRDEAAAAPAGALERLDARLRRTSSGQRLAQWLRASGGPLTPSTAWRSWSSAGRWPRCC